MFFATGAYRPLRCQDSTVCLWGVMTSDNVTLRRSKSSAVSWRRDFENWHKLKADSYSNCSILKLFGFAPQTLALSQGSLATGIFGSGDVSWICVHGNAQRLERPPHICFHCWLLAVHSSEGKLLALKTRALGRSFMLHLGLWSLCNSVDGFMIFIDIHGDLAHSCLDLVTTDVNH